MGVPTPAIPTFTDGLLVHAVDLNALASNLTNLYNYNQAGFFTQKPCAIVKQQSAGQSIPNNTNTLVTFDTAVVNTDNMWTASVPNQLTVQHAGIYLIIGQTVYPNAGSPGVSVTNADNIMVNGTSPATNAVSSGGGGSGINASGPTTAALANLAVNATIYLNTAHNYGSSTTLLTTYGGSFLCAIFITPST